MNLICENCTRKFSIGISSKGGSVTFMGGLNAQCPFCDHMNVTPGGKFDFDRSGNVIQAFLLESNIPENDLLKFIDIVKVYIARNKYDQAAFQDEIISINPRLKKLASLIEVKTSADFFSLLTLLVTLVVAILSNKESVPVVNNTTVNNYIYQDRIEAKSQHQGPVKKHKGNIKQKQK